jgi:hypothetical protein
MEIQFTSQVFKEGETFVTPENDSREILTQGLIWFIFLNQTTAKSDTEALQW